MNGIQGNAERGHLRDFVQGHTSDEVGVGSRRCQMFHGAREGDLRFRRMQRGVSERDAVLFQRERQLDVYTQAVHQERADIDFAGIAGHDGIETERGA